MTFLLLPQSTQDVILEIQVGETTKLLTLSTLDPHCQSLESGKELNLNFIITSGKILFSGMTVESWGDQGSIEDDIII